MTDAELDARLRAMAHDSLADRATTVDTEGQLAEFRSTLAGEAWTPERAGRARRRWMLAAASLLVVAGLGAVAALTMRPDDGATKGDTDAATTVVPTSSASLVPAETLPPVTPSAPAVSPDCFTEPVTPPTMVDGTAPGEPDIETTGTNRIATWPHDHSQFAVTQVLDQARDPSVLDAAIADGSAFVNGTIQAVAIPAGDLPLGPSTIYLRDTADGCLRAYGVGPGLSATDAQAVAARWVNALATASDQTGPVTVPTSLRYDVGEVSVLVPIAGFPHPNQVQPSELTVANQHWVVPGCCNLGVGVQNVTPLLRPEDRYKQQTIGGHDWSFYEIGPLDGSTLTATTNLADGTSILVGVQMFNSSTEEVSAALDAAVASIQVAPTSD